MAGLSGEVTTDAVKATFTATEPMSTPLADGIDVTCDGQQVASGSRPCASQTSL